MVLSFPNLSAPNLQSRHGIAGIDDERRPGAQFTVVDIGVISCDDKNIETTDVSRSHETDLFLAQCEPSTEVPICFNPRHNGNGLLSQ